MTTTSPRPADRSTHRSRVSVHVFVATFALVASEASAQHSDILIQHRDGMLVTGGASFDDSQFGVGAGTRVYSSPRLSRIGSALTAEDPGFVSVTDPAGSPPAFALPAGETLEFNILPTTIDGASSNLFFWDGQSGETVDDVQFQPVQGGIELTMSLFNFSAVADGSGEPVEGFPIVVTDQDGGVHRHLDFDISGAQDDGIFLLSMEFEMEGFDPSDPVFVLLGMRNPHPFLPPPSPFFDFAEFWVPRQDAALGWATANLLVQPADFDSDGDVDSADRTTITANWTGALGVGEGTRTREQGDADGDGDVDSADQTILITSWTGAMMAAEAPRLVPEPTSGVSLIAALATLLWLARSTIAANKGKQ